MPAPKNNTFGEKDEADLIRFPVTIRGLEEERQAWKRAAVGQKFNAWARSVLNAAASKKR